MNEEIDQENQEEKSTENLLEEPTLTTPSQAEFEEYLNNLVKDIPQ